IRRGNIAATLSVNRLVPPAIRVNRQMLAKIVTLLGDLSEELSDKIKTAPPRLDGLIGLRGVIETVEDESEPVVEARRAAIIEGWSSALVRLAAARAEEGARLAAALTGQRAELAALVEAAAGCAAAQPEAIRARLAASLAELSGIAP